MTAATMADLEEVLTGAIPLNPAMSDQLGQAREKKMLREHQEQVQELTARGYVVVRQTRNDSPLRPGGGTYQLLTWLQLPAEGSR